MTDSNQAPNQSPSGSPDYEGTDPDRSDREREGPRIGVSTVQVGASAAAAVTSALAASFFGVAGTLIGAAVGSIVSTIAGALYTEYLSRAHERIRVTRQVAIQRIPSEVIASTPLRRLTRPTDLPGRESLQPIGEERRDETIALPVEEAEELRRRPEGMAELGQSGASRADSNGAGTRAGAPPQPARAAWKRPAIAMAAVSTAGFLIAIGVVLVTETAIGHPVSGGDSGTTISKITKSDTTSESDVTPTEKATEAPAATEESSDAETTEEAPTTDSAETSEEEPTDEATSDPTDPATDSGALEGQSEGDGPDAAETP